MVKSLKVTININVYSETKSKWLKELVKQKCEELKIEIIAIECDKDHVHMFLNCLPTLSPANIILIF